MSPGVNGASVPTMDPGNGATLGLWNDPIGYLRSSTPHIATFFGIGVAAAYVYHRIYNQANETSPATAEHMEIPEAPSLEVEDPLRQAESKEFSLVEEAGAVGDAEAKLGAPGIEIFTVPRGYHTPGISPFPLELETILRLASIPYKVHEPASSVKYNHGAIPEETGHLYARVNGHELSTSETANEQDVADQLCSLLEINLDSNANEGQRKKASKVAKFLKIHIAWGIALWRWILNERRELPQIVPITFGDFNHLRYASIIIQAAGVMKGFRAPRETVPEITNMVLGALTKLSFYLGDKPYFSGFSPGRIDCTAFALLSQLVWNMPGSPFEDAIRKHGNLPEFVLRMKENYWSDWTQLLHTPVMTDTELRALSQKRKYSAYKLNEQSSLIIAHEFSDLELADVADIVIPQDLDSNLLTMFLHHANEKEKAQARENRKRREEEEGAAQAVAPMEEFGSRPSSALTESVSQVVQDVLIGHEFDKKRFVQIAKKIKAGDDLTVDEQDFWKYAYELYKAANAKSLDEKGKGTEAEVEEAKQPEPERVRSSKPDWDFGFTENSPSP